MGNPLLGRQRVDGFLCLLIVNSVNLIDGIDGLSSGLSMFALSGFAALFWQLGVESYTLVSLGLIGAVMAFFFFNVFRSEERRVGKEC